MCNISCDADYSVMVSDDFAWMDREYSRFFPIYKWLCMRAPKVIHSNRNYGKTESKCTTYVAHTLSSFPW